MNPLKKINGLWIGIQDNRIVMIIDPNLIDEEGRQAVIELMTRREKTNEQRDASVLVRKVHEYDVAV